MNSKLNDKNYIAIADWMVKDYNLKSKDLLTFAIIYGFSQDEESVFSGSLEYLSKWLNMQANNVTRQLKRLVDARLIIKKRKSNGLRIWCEYTTRIKKGSATDSDYIFITPDMVEMGLKDRELIVYALIYGFSRKGSNCAFTGSNSYIASWLNINKAHVNRYTQSLMKKGLIEKVCENNQIKYYALKPKNKGNQNESMDHNQIESTPNQIESMDITKLRVNILSSNTSNNLIVVEESEKIKDDLFKKLDNAINEYKFKYTKEIQLYSNTELIESKYTFVEFIINYLNETVIKKFIESSNSSVIKLFDMYKGVTHKDNPLNEKYSYIKNPEGFMINEFNKMF